MRPRPHQTRTTLTALWLTALWLTALLVSPGVAGADGAASELVVVARHAVPGKPSSPVDARWASGDSVYLARVHGGVWEVALDDRLTPRRQLMPGSEDLATPMGIYPFSELAVAGHHLALAHLGHQISWRSTDRRPDHTVSIDKQRFAIPVDLDARGDRLVVLGAHALAGERWDGDGGVLWLGSFSHGLGDLRPLLHEPAPDETADDRFTKCSLFGLGAVRFLSDGSFLVVPGSSPGAHQFSATGRPLRSWSDEETGLDTAAACEELSVEASRARKQDPDLFRTWRDRLHVVDDVLPLAQGPGLLVRSVEAGGLPTWQLRILGREGVEIYEVPVVAQSPDDRLHGDVQGHRILLLRYPGRPADDHQPNPGEMIVARLP